MLPLQIKSNTFRSVHLGAYKLLVETHCEVGLAIDALSRVQPNVVQCIPPIRLFGYKECLHIVYGLQVPIPAYLFVMNFLSI